MEKISGILPATARVTSVDLRDSGPVRAGTVGFGQNEAASATSSRRAAHGRDLPFPEMEGASSRPMTKDEQQAEMVRKMNEKFFNTKRTEAVQTPGTQAPGVQQPSSGSVEQAAAAAPAQASQQQAKIERIPEKPEEELEGGPTGFFKNAPAVDELYPKGSFLNTVA